MKKVFIIFSIFLLITNASCGRKSTEEQALADSIAAAAAADSIAAVEVGFRNKEDYVDKIYNSFGGESVFGKYTDFVMLLETDESYAKDIYNQLGGEPVLGKYENFRSLTKFSLLEKDKALIDSYELAKQEGYKKSFQQFKKLLAQNPDALNDVYTLYSNRKGYTGDLRSYLNLIRIEPKASDEELRFLYDVLVENGSIITRTFEEFQLKWEEEDGYKEKVFDVVYQDNLYWSGRDVFFQKYLDKIVPEIQDLKQVLRDFVGASNSGKYADEATLLSKFPQLQGYDIQVLRDFIATSNSGKYATEDELFAKFPEFKLSAKNSKEQVVNSQESTQSLSLSSGETNLILSLIFGSIGMGLIIIFRKKLAALFVLRKIQDFILLIITIVLLVLGIFLLIVSNDFRDEDFFFAVVFSVFGIIFLAVFLKRKFIDFTLFFIALGGLSLAGVLFFDNNGEKSPLLFVPAVFILFILWKDNFFTKEPRNKTPEEIREKGKRMLDELREMVPDESMIGKTVVKKASVKKEEDKNSPEE
jgi:hypothetical protein